MYNSILANSTAPPDCYNFPGASLTGSNNIIETTAGGTSSCSAITLSTSDPSLGALTGAPATIRSAPAARRSIRVTDTICAAAPVNAEDQRGLVRPVDGDGVSGAACDIGSFEYRPSHVFNDLPVTGKEWMEPWVNEFYFNGITTGCGASPLVYCPESSVTRAAMAVFLLRAIEGPSYVPPPATHTFSDMPVPGKEWMEPWVDEFYAEGITTGCGIGPLSYCPENPVTRAAMAVFLLRALEGSSYVPPQPLTPSRTCPWPARSGWSRGWTSSIPGASPPAAARAH